MAIAFSATAAAVLVFPPSVEPDGKGSVEVPKYMLIKVKSYKPNNPERNRTVFIVETSVKTAPVETFNGPR